MENIILTQLSIQELRNLIREEMQNAVKQSSILGENSSDPYLNIEEVADFLDLAVPTVYGLVHRRQIPHIKMGKYLKFKKSKIIEWLESGNKKTKRELIAEAQKYV